MPETRYIEVYDNQGNLIAHEPYEVTDEELQEEANKATAEDYLAKSPDVITQPQMWFLLREFAKKLGYETPQ